VSGVGALSLLPSNSRSTEGKRLLLFLAAGEGGELEPQPRATLALLLEEQHLGRG